MGIRVIERFGLSDKSGSSTCARRWAAFILDVSSKQLQGYKRSAADSTGNVDGAFELDILLGIGVLE